MSPLFLLSWITSRSNFCRDNIAFEGGIVCLQSGHFLPSCSVDTAYFDRHPFKHFAQNECSHGSLTGRDSFSKHIPHSSLCCCSNADAGDTTTQASSDIIMSYKLLQATSLSLVVTRWNYVRGSITSFTTSLKDPIFSKVLLHAWASWKRRTGYTRSIGSYTDRKPNFGHTGTHFRHVVKIVELIGPISTNDICVFCQN